MCFLVCVKCVLCYALLCLMGVKCFMFVVSCYICLLCCVLLVIYEGRSPSCMPNACNGPFSSAQLKIAVFQSIFIRFCSALDILQIWSVGNIKFIYSVVCIVLGRSLALGQGRRPAQNRIFRVCGNLNISRKP